MYRFSSIAGLRSYLASRCSQDQFGMPDASHSLAFVPTMGALHAGHYSLIETARRENHTLVVSIFVNPLQFGPQEDLERYPRPLEADLQACERLGVDAVFTPTPEILEIPQHPEDASSPALFQVQPPDSMVNILCGVHRPGHFQGVATIVAKLFHIVQPNRAYFGQKDAQQLAILRRMVRDLNFSVEIVGCPTVREANGLALSSRNQYLSVSERERASLLFKSLQAGMAVLKSGETRAEAIISAVHSTLSLDPDLQVEYIELVDLFTFTPLTVVKEQGLLALAARMGKTRLIDNVVLLNRQPIIAIDGPAGAGKSTVARRVAQALNLLYLDSGAMYRAVTWLALQQGVSLNDESAIAELVSTCQLSLQNAESGMRVSINNEDVTQAIRSVEVSAQVSTIAAQSSVRHELVKRQQQFGRQGGVVMEGRDIGTYVFPDAELKIFMTASVQERARRRQSDLQGQGVGDLSLDQLEQAILERDLKDSTRSLAPLRQAPDAIEISTDGMTIEMVIQRIVDLYHQLVKS